MDEAVENHESEQGQEQTGRLTRRWFWLVILSGALGFFAVVAVWQQVSPDSVNGVFGTLVDVDLSQDRIDTALPLPNGDLSIVQRFVPRQNGLQEIEVTLARYGETPAADVGLLTLQLSTDDGQLLAEQTLETAHLEHNQEHRFTFPPQPRSQGQPYLLTLSGNAANTISVWGYSMDVYGGGGITLDSDQAGEQPITAAQDLRFITRYRLGWLQALIMIAETFYFEGVIFLLALIMLPLPGCLLLFLYHDRWKASDVEQREAGGPAWPWDPAAWWGAAFALGIATWPLIWLWGSMVGVRFSTWLLWLLIIGGWIAVILLWWRERDQRRWRSEEAGDEQVLLPQPKLTLPWQKEHIILLLIILLAFAVRLLAVRDVIFPPWVDSSRHALITAVMAAGGQAIRDYAPFLPVDRFPYHFGFHTLSSTLALMSNWPLNRLLLYFGQLLNALVPLALYTAVWLASRRRDAGLIAAFLVAIPFFFPAYYATWGRFTQLAAVFLLPVLLALTWRLVRGKGGWQHVWWVVALLTAGLFLTHFRVFVYYLPFALLVWLVSLGRNGRWLAAATGLTLLLVLPRVVQLLLDANPLQRIGQTIPNYNNFPVSYFNAGWEDVFVYIAAAAAIIALIAAIRRRSWAALPLLLLVWVAVLFLLLSLDRLGLPGTSLVNLNSMYIILFVPLAMFLALVAGPLWHGLRQQHWLLQLAGYLLLGILLGTMLLFGVRQQINILNANTILAFPEDYIALRWVEENLPDDATIAVNSWRWLGETWAAADGGAWLLPMTGRAVTTPPVDHIYNPELFRAVREFNETAAAVADWSDPLQADWLTDQGVTHIYVGKRGGYFDPAVLARNPQLELLYGRHGVYIFAISS